MAVGHAVGDFVIAVKKGALRSDASNAPDRAPSIAQPRRVLRPWRARVYVAVHRHDNRIYFKRLEPTVYRLLAALQKGETLARACVRAFPSAAVSSPLWRQKVRDWFQSWAELGWFYQP